MSSQDKIRKAYQIQLPSDLDFIPPLRQFVAEIARAEGFPKKFCFRTEIIVDELFTNAIVHGSQDIGSTVSLETGFEDGKMSLVVKDEGGSKKNLDNLKRAVYESGTATDAKKGRGLVIVQMLSNELNINLEDDGYTQVRVLKIKEPEDPGALKETLLYESDI